MNDLLSYPLLVAKRLYAALGGEKSNFGRNLMLFSVKGYANDLIYNSLLNDEPLMVARLGANELTCMVNYLGVSNPKDYKSIEGFIKSRTPHWWWSEGMLQNMEIGAGFFPANAVTAERFSEMMISDLPKVDILGSWLLQESFFKKELANSKKVVLEDLEPFFTAKPWTWALKGKKVLVIHPFSEQIESQYLIRDKIFPNNLLPEFELRTIKSVQSLARERTVYKDWFEALEAMKKQIKEIDFDVCIIGCGAYGFPLASYVKNLGKKAIHLGGVTQLLFGIKGSRWERYLVYPYENLYNEYWVRPSDSNKPKNASSVEGACYW